MFQKDKIMQCRIKIKKYDVNIISQKLFEALSVDQSKHLLHLMKTVDYKRYFDYF